MKIESVSHLHGETIIKHDFPTEYTDICDVLVALEAPLRPATPYGTGRAAVPKRQRKRFGGRSGYALLPVDQQAMNDAIAHALRPNWTTQPLATGGVFGGSAPSGLRGDFVRGRVFVEVEFGNSASMFRDLFKFQIASRSGKCDAAVLIVATEKLARLFDQGVTTFEQAKGLLPYMAIGIQMPIWIIGIEPESFAPVETRYEEMRAVAEANGLECHPFKDANPTRYP